MPVKTTFLLLLISVSSFVFLNSGCGKAGNGTFGSFDLSSITPPAAPPADTPATGDPVMNENAFYLAIAPMTNYIGHMSKLNSFSEACSIPKSTLASQDIMCLLDVPEGELFGKDLDILFNVPKGMCRYLIRDPYWYFNGEVGVGPANIAITVTQSTDPTATTYDCDADGITYSGTSRTGCAALGEANITFNSSDVPTIACVYDACCAGSYNSSVRVFDPSGDLSTGTDTTNTLWGSNYTTCIGGPPRTDWTAFDQRGFPTGLQSYAGDGTNDVYKLQALITSRRAFARHVANYFTPGLHTHSGSVDPTVSDLPFFMDPIDDRSGSPIGGASTAFPRPNPYYSFRCFDENYELIHRIRLQIRDWDTIEEYTQYITSQGTLGNPSNNGLGGVNCNGLTDGSVCNDFYNLDDFFNISLGGSYDTTNRQNNFPFDRPY